MTVDLVQALPLDRVRPNPHQPRKQFEQGAIADLATSIRERKQLQPILVRPDGDEFEIVAGERRWRAHCFLRDKGQWPAGTIDAIVRDMSLRERDLLAITENMARADITPMEEARAFKRLLDEGMTPQELAASLGIQQSWRITDRVRLLNLAPEHITLLEGGNLSQEAAYEISRLTSHADQTKVIRMINGGKLTGYNAIRAAVQTILGGGDQTDMFGGARVASEEELKTVAGMEARIQRAAAMLSGGFDEGEVVIARKVAPDRARLMADRLKVLRDECLMMENQLRRAAAQGELLGATDAD